MATIGNRLENMSRQMAEDGLMLQAAILDAIGSVTIDRIAEYIELQIEDRATTEGMFISPRLSPGYCDWSIRQQKEIFRIVHAGQTGITLTEDFLMVPQKSVSGIIGIGNTPAIQSYNPCLNCKERNCPGRRK
jgi:cobalamin-dependent methionine synthase I